jgi:thiol-disulfide isomerase/thioredoxin
MKRMRGSYPLLPATNQLTTPIPKQDFEKLLNEKDAWVVMFYAPWCAHCQVSPQPL